MMDDIVIHCIQNGVECIGGHVRPGRTDAQALIAVLQLDGVTYVWVAKRPPIETQLPTAEERAAIAALTPKIRTVG